MLIFFVACTDGVLPDAAVSDDEVVLRSSCPDCSDSYLQGLMFDHTDNSCDFGFQIRLASGAKVSQVVWDFGDGNTATTDPSQLDFDSVEHPYTETGQYTVTVTVYYINGCCEMATVDVKCERLCAYFLCYEDYFSQFGCTSGVTVKIDGVPTTINFLDENGEPYSISNNAGNFNTLAAALADIANQLGVEFYVNDPGIGANCKKGDVDFDLGLFFVDSGVEFVSLNGADDSDCDNPQSGNAGEPSVDFFRKCEGLDVE